jgi:ABC-type uncharacterized transport system permease subunit
MTAICIAAELVALIGYLLAAVVYPVRLLRPDRDLTAWGLWGLTVGAGLQGLGLLAHTARQSEPLLGQYANVSFLLVVCLCVGLWFIEKRTERPAIAAFLTPCVFLVALLGLTRAPQLPGIGAWTVVHIVLLLLAYAAFGLAFAMAMAYLVNDFFLKHKQVERLRLLPPLPTADRIGHAAICVGLPLYTAGLLVAAFKVWHLHAGLDPKAVLAIANWLVYAVYLVLRDGPGMRGKRLQAFLVLGFVLAMASFIFLRHNPVRYHA